MRISNKTNRTNDRWSRCEQANVVRVCAQACGVDVEKAGRASGEDAPPENIGVEVEGVVFLFGCGEHGCFSGQYSQVGSVRGGFGWCGEGAIRADEATVMIGQRKKSARADFWCFAIAFGWHT